MSIHNQELFLSSVRFQPMLKKMSEMCGIIGW